MKCWFSQLICSVLAIAVLIQSAVPCSAISGCCQSNCHACHAHEHCAHCQHASCHCHAEGSQRQHKHSEAKLTAATGGNAPHSPCPMCAGAKAMFAININYHDSRLADFGLQIDCEICSDLQPELNRQGLYRQSIVFESPPLVRSLGKMLV